MADPEDTGKLIMLPVISADFPPTVTFCIKLVNAVFNIPGSNAVLRADGIGGGVVGKCDGSDWLPPLEIADWDITSIDG